MPIHEIGLKNRRGTLGSPYSVKDYYSINPEFGTLEDLKHFVKRAHDIGMYVILDWVANHTAWDCNLVTEHPEWYARDWKGDFRPTPWWDWDGARERFLRRKSLRCTVMSSSSLRSSHRPEAMSLRENDILSNFG